MVSSSALFVMLRTTLRVGSFEVSAADLTEDLSPATLTPRMFSWCICSGSFITEYGRSPVVMSLAGHFRIIRWLHCQYISSTLDFSTFLLSLQLYCICSPPRFPTSMITLSSRSTLVSAEGLAAVEVGVAVAVIVEVVGDGVVGEGVVGDGVVEMFLSSNIEYSIHFQTTGFSAVTEFRALGCRMRRPLGRVMGVEISSHY